jgi:hypothetical protein
MGKQLITIDDLTGEPIEDGEGENIKLTVNGAAYELDLTKANAKKFYDVIGPYIDKAAQVDERPATPARRSSSGGKKKTDPDLLAAMRTWLRENGHEVSDRGRIAQNLQDIYNEAHK